jgi:hypothetical protein
MRTRKAFYLLIILAIVYNLFLMFSKEKQPDTHAEMNRESAEFSRESNGFKNLVNSKL